MVYAKNGRMTWVWRRSSRWVRRLIVGHCRSCKKKPLTLNAPIATKVVCSSRLLKCLRSLYGKQCGPRSDCSSYMSSLFWVHAVCLYTLFVSNARQLFAADDFSRRHFQMHFFLGDLKVNPFKPNGVYRYYKLGHSICILRVVG